MDIFDLEKHEIEVLFLRSRGLTPQQVQVQLNISSSEYFERQKLAFTKLEIPGEPKQKWANFAKSRHAEILSTLTDEDIKNWDQKRQVLGKRVVPTKPRTLATPLLYGVVVLVILAAGIFLGRVLFSNSATPSVSPTSDIHPSPVSTTQLTETAPAVSPTSDAVVIIPSDTAAPTISVTVPSSPTETVSPFGLGIGQQLQDDRVTLKLIDVRWNEGYDNVSSLGRAPVSYVFEYTNHSGETIVVQFDKSYFVVEDNTGRTAECWFFVSPYPAFEKWSSTLHDNETALITTRCGNGEVPSDVTSYTLTIHPFTSLPESTWVVDVPR